MIAGLVLLAVLGPAGAFGASTQVRVTASIRPWLKFSAVPRVASYRVDAAAIHRGYVDLPSSLDVELATNLRHKVVLELAGAGPGTIMVLDSDSAGGGRLYFDGVTGNAPVVKRFDLRVLLPPGLEQGTYPLHIQLSAAMI